jgi:hypothetical protein
VEVEAVAYRSKFLSLNEAVELIAGRLAAADQVNCADQAEAINDARTQLIQALFEGTVRAQGVRWYPEPPGYEPAEVEYDSWTSIELGVWSHVRYEKQADNYRLDTIDVQWSNNSISYYDSEGEWGECVDGKIRLPYADIDREFPAQQMTTQDSPLPGVRMKPTYRTGTPGRPSSRDLAKHEMQRRAKEGRLCSKVSEEMKELCGWLKKNHPDAAQPTPKALETSLRSDYRCLKSSASSSK